MENKNETEITLMRQSTFFQFVMRMNVWIDGEKVKDVSIKNGGMEQITVPNGEHTIYAGTTSFDKGNELAFSATGESIFIFARPQLGKIGTRFHLTLGNSAPPETLMQSGFMQIVKGVFYMLAFRFGTRYVIAAIISLIGLITGIKLGTDEVEVVTGKVEVVTGKCGEEVYENASMKFCYKGAIYYRCGGKEYNPDLQFCYKDKISERQSAPVPGTLTDERDKKVYKTVTIGRQTWMAENLNYAAKGSVCYDNQESNCEKYGRLYDWVTAMGHDSKCNSKQCGSKFFGRDICPKGWSVPGYGEFTFLAEYVSGMDGLAGFKDRKGKSKAEYLISTNGFNAKFGGCGDSDGNFYGIGDNGNWWSSVNNRTNAYYLNVESDVVNSNSKYYKTFLFSIRCLKD